MTSAREPFAPFSPVAPSARGIFFVPRERARQKSRPFAQNKGAFCQNTGTIGRKPPIYLEKSAENRIFAYPLRSVSQR